MSALESENITLYGYWRSSASWRIRIVLNLKKIQFVNLPINLLLGEHKEQSYLEMQPQGYVPCMKFPGNRMVIQSPAIAELLEEQYPQEPLLPGDCWERAKVREITALISCDIHPVQNLNVLRYAGEERKAEWAKRIIY